jgi:hypothetical protein
MGFMDKAKKLAEQAQQKLDEAQQQFNQGQSETPQAGAGQTFDQHGRPVRAEETAAPEGGPAPTPAEAAGEDTGAAPDPFRPIQ